MIAGEGRRVMMAEKNCENEVNFLVSTHLYSMLFHNLEETKRDRTNPIYIIVSKRVIYLNS